MSSRIRSSRVDLAMARALELRDVGQVAAQWPPTVWSCIRPDAGVGHAAPRASIPLCAQPALEPTAS